MPYGSGTALRGPTPGSRGAPAGAAVFEGQHRRPGTEHMHTTHGDRIGSGSHHPSLIDERTSRMGKGSKDTVAAARAEQRKDTGPDTPDRKQGALADRRIRNHTPERLYGKKDDK